MVELKCHRAENEPRSGDGVCSAHDWSGRKTTRNATMLLLTTTAVTLEMSGDIRHASRF